MKAKFIYETIGDVLKGKSDEEIEKSLETSDSSFDNLLLKSAEIGFIKGVKIALDKGADIHIANNAALRWAANSGNANIVKLLLDRGANIHALYDDALRLAASGGHITVVKLLLSRGADVKKYGGK